MNCVVFVDKETAHTQWYSENYMVSFTLTIKSLDLKKEFKMMEFLAEMATKKIMYSK